MKLSEEAIEDFKEIYYREYGKEISDEEAQEMGQNLLSLFHIICRPLPEDENNMNYKGTESI
jgi:hypothetical protein